MPNETEAGTGGGFMNFLRGVPEMITPGPDAGRIGMAIWAASEGGPGALMSVLDSFKAEDMRRYKTVSSPEFQDYVDELVTSGRAASKSEAIQLAQKVFPGAKGYKPPMAPELMAIDAPTGTPGSLATEGPSMPDRQEIDMPQLPPVPAEDRIGADAAKYVQNRVAAGGTDGEVAMAKYTKMGLTPGLTQQLMQDNIARARELNKDNPDYLMTPKLDARSGNVGFEAELNKNIFPPIVEVTDPTTGEKRYRDIRDELPDRDWNTLPDGRLEMTGWSKRREAREGAIGLQEAKDYVPGQPVPAAGSGAPGTGPVSSKMLPGFSGRDKDFVEKQAAEAAQLKAAADSKREANRRAMDIDRAANDQMVDNIEAFITDQSLPGADIGDIALMPRLFGKAGEIAGDIIYQGKQTAKSYLPNAYPDLKGLNVQIDSFLGNLARRYGGEKGVLTEKDIARMRNVFDVTNLVQSGAFDITAQIRENLHSIAERQYVDGWKPKKGDRRVGGDLNPIDEPEVQAPAAASGATPEQTEAFRNSFKKAGSQ